MASQQVIAISNRKGGSGKSTVSVNLAAEFAKLGRRVLLVDLDSQGHCAVGLGVKVQRDEPFVHHLFVDANADLLRIIRPSAYPNLHLAPADQRFEHGSGERDQHRLARALAHAEIAERFDMVIVDTPPSLDYLLLNALTAANWLMIPFVPHHLGMEGVLQLMRVLFKVISGPNPHLKILGFLPTMAAEHIRQHRTISAEVSRQFGAHRLLPGIRNDIRLAEAFAVGQPISHYAPKSRGAEDFGQLATAVFPALCTVDDAKNP